MHDGTHKEIFKYFKCRGIRIVLWPYNRDYINGITIIGEKRVWTIVLGPAGSIAERDYNFDYTTIQVPYLKRKLNLP